MESAKISLGGRLKSRWGTRNLNGDANARWGNAYPLQFKYCLGRHFQRKPGAATYATTPLPPSEDCTPKKLTGSGLLESKSRTLDSQNSAYRPRIREQGLFFRNFCRLTLSRLKNKAAGCDLGGEWGRAFQ